MDYKPQISTNIASTTNSSEKSTVTFDIMRYIGAVIGNWYWILLSILIALFLGFLYLQFTQPMYAIKSALVLSEDENGNSEMLDKLNIVKKSPVNLYNEMNTLHSEDLVTQAVDSLQMHIRYFVKSKLNNKELYAESPLKIVFDSNGYSGNHVQFTVKYTSDGHFDVKEGDLTSDVAAGTWVSRPFGRYKIEYDYNAAAPNKYLLSPVIIKIIPIESEVRRALGDLKVSSSDNRTSVIDLYYVDNIPERGVDFLRMLIRIYYRNNLKSINLAANQQRQFINDHKNDLMRDMQAVDSTVENIKLANGFLDEKETTTIVTKKNEVERNIDDLKKKRRALINLRNLLTNSKYQIIVPLDIDDNILNSLISEYNRLVQKLETQEKVQELGSSNPFLVQTIVEIDALKKRILEVLNKITGTIDNNLQVVTQTETQFSNRMKNVPGIEGKISEVKRGYDILNNMYLILFQKGIENELAVYNAQNKSKILIEPYAVTTPISPIKLTIYGFALLIGLLLPLIILLISQLLIKKVVNESDIRSLTDIPLIGIVSKAPTDSLRNNYIAISPSVRTGIAEQFRMLRTNLEFVTFTENRKVITITSSDSGEGKTFISINLGLILALGTKRVVVVEFDLRKPRMAELLKISDVNGVSEYLAGHVELKDLVKPSGINSNLYIANCGQIPSNPGDLLAYPSTPKLIEDLQEMFDIVIIDTPPVGLVSDALVLSKLAGLNLFVVRQAYSTKKNVVDFDALYKEGKMHNPAIVFNNVGYYKQYGYYTDPNKDYEMKLTDYVSSEPKKGVFSFFKK